jgi:hypothetical protein
MNRHIRWPRVALWAVLAALAIAGMVLASCSKSATSADLKGVEPQKPDKIEAYTNIDGHPNLVRLCIGKVAFVTTTRESGVNFARVPEWDVPFCGAAATPAVSKPAG